MTAQKRWNLVVDVALCENCNNCMLSAKDELVGNRFAGYSEPHAPQGRGVMWIERRVRGSGHMVDAAHVPMTCNHCDDAPCVRAGQGAVIQRPDGVVLIHPEKAKGRRDLLDTCPYGAMVWNEDLNLPQTWFFDAHLLDQGWAAPRCVGSCPTGAMQVYKVTDADMALKATEQDLRVLSPELGTRPRVHYRNLHRWDRSFVGGTVLSDAGRLEALAEAEVELLVAGSPLAASRTNAFGDFRFDNLTPGDREHTLQIAHPGYLPVTCVTPVHADGVNLGVIVLRPPETA